MIPDRLTIFKNKDTVNWRKTNQYTVLWLFREYYFAGMFGFFFLVQYKTVYRHRKRYLPVWFVAPRRAGLTPYTVNWRKAHRYTVFVTIFYKYVLQMRLEFAHRISQLNRGNAHHAHTYKISLDGCT